MKLRLARIFLPGMFLFSFLSLLLIPFGADAQLVNCGRGDNAPCTMCHLVVMAADIVRWLMSVMTIIAIAAIFAMGVLYIVSAGNESRIKTAKSGIWAALIGFAIILCSWLIVNIVLLLLANSSFLSNFQQTGAFSFSCSTASTAGTATPGQGMTYGGGRTSTVPGAGTCQAITGSSSACSTANLSSSCFGESNANRISQLCNIESRGVATQNSTVDVCKNYGGKSFSGGLFQINVFANGSMLNSRCANLGSKGQCSGAKVNGICTVGWNCQINNVSDFDYCMGLTHNAQNNINAACKLGNNGSNLNPWACSANKCNLGSTTLSACR